MVSRVLRYPRGFHTWTSCAAEHSKKWYALLLPSPSGQCTTTRMSYKLLSHNFKCKFAYLAVNLQLLQASHCANPMSSWSVQGSQNAQFSEAWKRQRGCFSCEYSKRCGWHNNPPSQTSSNIVEDVYLVRVVFIYLGLDDAVRFLRGGCAGT